MTWYNILFFAVFTFFILRTIISFAFGDTDVDFDADGDIDYDVSSMLSFKGALHFLLGFSTYLAAVARFGKNFTYVYNLDTYDYDKVYHFTTANYITAIGIGIIFMVILWFLYKLMMKLNHSSTDQVDIRGCYCSILTNLGSGAYKVLVKTSSGTLERVIKSYSYNDSMQIGSEHKIIKMYNEYFIE